MIIEHVRIAVLDAYDNVLTYMDNRLPKALHYYDDTLTEYLKGSAYTYSFTASADHEDSQYLVEGNKIAFVYRNKSYYLNIMIVEKDEYTVTVQAFGLLFELLNEDKEEYSATKAMTFVEYLAAFDPEHIITLGNNEVSNKSITHEWTGTESMLSRLYSLATVFDAEIEFIAQLNQNYSLSGIIMNVYQKHSDTVQGIGTNRTDQILRYGKEIDGIRKTSDISELYTAIRPTGKDGLTVRDVVIEEYDADGNLEYSSPKGNRNIYAVQARDRFPSNLTAPSTERYIALVWSYDTDNVNTLAGQALARLKEVCTPQVSYEVSGYIDADIGDTFTIQDMEYTPQLLLSARVTEQQRSFTNPANNKTTFDNFKELQSEVDQSLLDRVNELIEAGISYNAYINSNNGTIFKNGTGSTTLTATITSGTSDVTGDMTIRWYKDGQSVGTGTSITVNASDITGKAVYSIQVANKNGDIIATTQVTVANVSDGAPGKDGQSLYTWLKYADSPTSGMSDSPDGKQYMGLAYNKTTPTESTNYSDYQWSLITGEGVPGPPGENGETLYTWIKYANDANGSGISDSPSGKPYIGFAYNKPTATESNNPADYTWSLIQGPQGKPGADGVGVQNVDVQYYSSTSNTSLSGGSWSTTAPTWQNGRYIWSKTVIKYTNGTTEETQPACITGGNGPTGANGVGVSSITEQYYSSTSPASLTGGSWSTTYPGWQNGKYIWTRSVIAYTNGQTTTTSAVCVTGQKGDTGATGATGQAGKDGQMLYATSSTAAGTAAKTATLSSGTLTLTPGATVSVRFTNANTASSPTLNINGTGAKAIYTQGVRYAYWSAGSTVVFTYDGSNWRVCSEPVYANTATIGNPAGYNVFIDGDSVEIRLGTTVLSTYKSNEITMGENQSMSLSNYNLRMSAPEGSTSGGMMRNSYFSAYGIATYIEGADSTTVDAAEFGPDGEISFVNPKKGNYTLVSENEINISRTVSRIGSIGIACGTKVVTGQGASATSAPIISLSEINDIFGDNRSSATNTAVIFSNGDGAANSAHIDGATCQNNQWYALFDRTTTTNIRVNYAVVRWDLGTGGVG